MDASHQTLLRLYGESLPVGVPPQPPDEADRLALMEAKAWMDARAPRAASPDAFALDAIFRAAAHGSPDGEVHVGARFDRAPLRRPNRFQRAWTFVGAAGAVAALGFAVVTVALRPATSGTTAVTLVRTAPAAAMAVPAAPAPTADAPHAASLAAVAVPPAAPAPVTAPPVRASAPVVAKSAPAPAALARSAAPAVASAGTLFRADDDAVLAAARTRAALLRARLDSAAWDAPAVAPSIGAGATRRFTQASHQ